MRVRIRTVPAEDVRAPGGAPRWRSWRQGAAQRIREASTIQRHRFTPAFPKGCSRPFLRRSTLAVFMYCMASRRSFPARKEGANSSKCSAKVGPISLVGPTDHRFVSTRGTRIPGQRSRAPGRGIAQIRFRQAASRIDPDRSRRRLFGCEIAQKNHPTE